MKPRLGFAIAAVLAASVLEPDAALAAPRQDPSTARRVDAVLAPRIATREANGTVMVFRDGRQVYRRDIGYADWEQRSPVDRRTRFRVASVTKTVTAGAAMILRTEKKLSFPAPVSQYLPPFPNGDKIRVFHLLVHASGLTEAPELANPLAERSLDETVAAIGTTQLAFEPGSNSRYGNAAYVVMAKLIEVASGLDFETYLDRAIFTPLGMTGSGNYATEAIVPHRAAGYQPGPGADGVAHVARESLSSSLGAGSLITTADDLMVWLEAVRTRKLFDIWAAEYPYGWGKRSYFGADAIEQTGRNAGFTSSVLIVPSKNLSVLCVFNVESGFFNTCGVEVAAAVLAEAPPKTSLVLEPGQNPDAAAAASLTGRYRTADGLDFELAWRDGALRNRWADSERWGYVLSGAQGRFLTLADSGYFTVERDSTGKAAILEWKSGDSAFRFDRVG